MAVELEIWSGVFKNRPDTATVPCWLAVPLSVEGEPDADRYNRSLPCWFLRLFPGTLQRDSVRVYISLDDDAPSLQISPWGELCPGPPDAETGRPTVSGKDLALTTWVRDSQVHLALTDRRVPFDSIDGSQPALVAAFRRDPAVVALARANAPPPSQEKLALLEHPHGVRSYRQYPCFAIADYVAILWCREAYKAVAGDGRASQLGRLNYDLAYEVLKWFHGDRAASWATGASWGDSRTDLSPDGLVLEVFVGEHVFDTGLRVRDHGAVVFHPKLSKNLKTLSWEGNADSTRATKPVKASVEFGADGGFEGSCQYPGEGAIGFFGERRAV